MQRYLILEDGTAFAGTGFGASIVSSGELVIQTGMTGYQETITDKVNTGCIIAFTAPTVGLVGVNRDNYESIDPSIRGVVVNELAHVTAHQGGKMSLADFLDQLGIPGINQIDVRALRRHIDVTGPQKASIVDAADEHAFDQLRALVLPHNQVQQVSTERPYPSPGTGRNIVVVDFGLKHSLLREFAVRDCNLTIVPATTTAERILNLDPDGVVLSDGPGDPEDSQGALPMISGIQEHLPLLSIGLGCELFAMANGATTKRLAHEHHGLNFAVREVATGRIDITSHDHSFTVDPASLEHNEELLITHLNILDQTVEGLRHRRFPAYGVQFQPEGAPGSNDADHVLTEFMELIDAEKDKAGKEATRYE